MRTTGVHTLSVGNCLGGGPTGGWRGRCLLLAFFFFSFSSPATLQLHAGKLLIPLRRTQKRSACFSASFAVHLMSLHATPL